MNGYNDIMDKKEIKKLSFQGPSSTYELVWFNLNISLDWYAENSKTIIKTKLKRIIWVTAEGSSVYKILI